MEKNTKFVIDDLYKDYEYTISYSYTAEIIATRFNKAKPNGRTNCPPFVRLPVSVTPK